MWILSLCTLILVELFFIYCLNKAVLKATSIIGNRSQESNSFGSPELDLALILLWIWSASIAMFVILSGYFNFSKIMHFLVNVNDFSEVLVIAILSLIF